MSVAVVGAIAGVSGAVAAGVGTAAGIAMTAGGAALGGLLGRSGDDAPASESGSQKYTADSLYQKLLAQSDPRLAASLYQREANQDYGRPAYARLEQGLMDTAIQGTQQQVDAEGYYTKVTPAQIPANGRFVETKDDQYAGYVNSNPDLLEEFNNLVPDGNIMDIARAGGVGLEIIRKLGKSGGVLSKAEFGKTHYEEIGQAEGRELIEMGSVVDSEGTVIPDTEERVFVGEEYAGKKINTGGAAATIAGNQQRDFYDESGKKITKRAGFDEEGNFEGTAQLATDVAFDTQQQQVQQEMGLMEEHGQRYTEAYRDQGDIREALSKVKELDKESANEGISRSATDYGSSVLRAGMLNEAIMGMHAGGSLTAREQRSAQQSARAAMQARGRVNDFGGIMAEMEQNEKYRAARRQERHAFAGSVMNAEQGLMDRQTARDSLYQSGLAQDRANAANRLGLEQATSADPLKATTGKDSGAGLAAGTNIYQGAAGAVNAGSNTYNPHTGMAFDQASAANQDTYNATIYGADQEKKAAIINAGANLAGKAFEVAMT